jgi:hypothetical protein
MLTINTVVKKINSLLLLAMILLTACKSSEDGFDSLDYKEKEEFYYKKVSQYGFRLKPFDPVRLMTVNYGDALNSFSKEKRDSISLEYKGYACFVFEIDVEGFTGDITDYESAANEATHEQKMNYYLFGMQNDFRLMNEKGIETPCIIYYYERLNEIAKTNRFIIGFKTPNQGGTSLEYNNPYLNCGKIKFSINKQHLAFNSEL